MNTTIDDINRIKVALDFLKEQQGFNVGGLYLSPRKDEIAIVGQTNYNDLDNLNKKIAKQELENIKAKFKEYRNWVKEFDDYFNDKNIRFCLAYDYGMGGIELCNESNGKIRWSYNIKE